MSSRNPNANPVIDVRPRWQRCMRATVGKQFSPATNFEANLNSI